MIRRRNLNRVVAVALSGFSRWLAAGTRTLGAGGLSRMNAEMSFSTTPCARFADSMFPNTSHPACGF